MTNALEQDFFEMINRKIIAKLDYRIIKNTINIENKDCIEIFDKCSKHISNLEMKNGSCFVCLFLFALFCFFLSFLSRFPSFSILCCKSCYSDNKQVRKDNEILRLLNNVKEFRQTYFFPHYFYP